MNLKFHKCNYLPIKPYNRKWSPVYLLVCFAIIFIFLEWNHLPDLERDQYKVEGLYWKNGEPLMESYAGLIPIRNEKHNQLLTQSGEMFFWYFPVQNQSLKSTAPLIIWLQGGRIYD
jgi:hypothetical protein